MMKQLLKNWRPLLAFALAFQLFENLLFAPSMGILGRALEGRPVVDSTQLVAFFLSPRGLVILFLAAMISLTIRLVEHAGLSALVLGALEAKPLQPLSTFRWLLAELPGLARIGVRIVGWGLIVSAPLLVLAGLLIRPLLAKHDINYYLANRPPEFITTALVLGLAGLATFLVAAWLLVRWRLVVQVCVFDRRDGGDAFREAAILSRGAWWALAGRCLAVVALLLALLLAAAGLQQAAVWLAMRIAGLGAISLAVSLTLVVVLRTVIGALVTSLGAFAEAAVFTAFYTRRRRELGGAPALPMPEPDSASPAPAPVWARGLAAGVLLGLLIASGISVALAADGLRTDATILVTAHRGGHKHAPENTAAAFREAIAAGADFAELDVLLSKDGALVVTHDSDFSRMGGVAKKVWDLTYTEIRNIPLGARSAPEFRNEPAPTLEEVLAIARDRIHLNIELKYYGDHQPRLAERVLEAVRAQGMTHQVVIQSLDYEPLMEVRRLAPEIPVGYLMSVNARHPERLKVDFLGVEQNRLTPSFVQAAHRRGQQVHAWTVDTPAAMDRMIDLGVDGLITNEPAEALRRVRAYQALSRSERALRRVHAWLGN
jgi:glycerophosphoryl diester phosphodiesterase